MRLCSNCGVEVGKYVEKCPKCKASIPLSMVKESAIEEIAAPFVLIGLLLGIYSIFILFFLDNYPKTSKAIKKGMWFGIAIQFIWLLWVILVKVIIPGMFYHS